MGDTGTHKDEAAGASVSSQARAPESDNGFMGVDALIVSFIAVLGLLGVLFYNRIERLGSDSSVYIVLAENLRTGIGYEFNSQPHTVYPPGFPMLLAGIGILFRSTSYELLIRWMPVFSSLGLAAWYFVLRRAAGRNVAAVACLLAATTQNWFAMNTGGVMSESAYILATGTTLLCLTLLMERRRRALPDAILVAGTILFALASVMIRSVGIALAAGMGAWVFSWMVSRRKLQLPQVTAIASTVLCVAALLLWVGYSIHVQYVTQDKSAMGSYASQFSSKDPHRPDLGKASSLDLVSRAESNLWAQSANIARLVTRLPYVAPLWYSPLVLLTLILLSLGTVRYLREVAIPVPAWYFLAYFGVYLLWPFDEGPRFMLPVAPLAFVLLWRGFSVARIRLQRITTRGAMLVAAILAVTGLASLASWPLPGFQAKASAAFWFVLAGLLVLYTLSGRHLRFDRDSAPRGCYQLGWTLVFFLFAVGIYHQCASARVNLNPDPTRYTHYSSTQFGIWLQTQPSCGVMAEHATIIHRVSKRPIVSFPITGEVETLVDTIRRNEVRYLMVSDPTEFPYFVPTETERYEKIIESYPGLLQLVHRGPGYRVFQVFAGPTSPPAAHD